MTFSVSFKHFFTVEIRHDYYLNKGRIPFEMLSEKEQDQMTRAYNIHDDLEIAPTEQTRNLFQSRGLIFQKTSSGFAVGIRAKPQGPYYDSGWRPYFPLDDNLAMTFYVQIKNPNFTTISDLPLATPYSNIYYFSNYSMNRFGERNFLSQLSDAGPYVTSKDLMPLYPSLFDIHMLSEGREIHDLLLMAENMNFDTTFTELLHVNPYQRRIQADLRKLIPGLYRLQVTNESQEPIDIEPAGMIYLDQQLYNIGVFGIIEIIHSQYITQDFRLIDNDHLPYVSPMFNIHFKNRETYWRYIFDEDQEVVEYELGELIQDGGVDEKRRFITKEPHPLTAAKDPIRKFETDTFLPYPGIDLIDVDTFNQKVFSEIYVRTSSENAIGSGKVPENSDVSTKAKLTLPNEIMQVETAIPAFIGFTEKAADSNREFKECEIKRIYSMEEYVEYFGEPQLEKEISVTIDEKLDATSNRLSLDINAKIGKRSGHIMNYALQLYFRNGGKSCYIISVGLYKNADDLIVLENLRKGLDSLKKLDGVTLIVIPDSLGLSGFRNFQIYQEALHHCSEFGDRMVLIDLPIHEDGVMAAATDLRNNIGIEHMECGAAYAPNLRTNINYHYNPEDVHIIHNVNVVSGGPVEGTMASLEKFDRDLFNQVHAAICSIPCILPPSSAIAGVYAKNDRTRGVWRAPANFQLVGVIEPTIDITDDQEERLYDDPISGKSINVIRAFTGKGSLVWGACTLAGADKNWRYIQVRRFVSMVRKSIINSTAFAVLEPLESKLWTTLRSMIERYLIGKWADGALHGTKQEEAFFIKIGSGKTMTPQDISEGRSIIQIGLALHQPGHFVEFQLEYLKMNLS